MLKMLNNARYCAAKSPGALSAVTLEVGLVSIALSQKSAAFGPEDITAVAAAFEDAYAPWD
jgi:hypothetical protein